MMRVTPFVARDLDDLAPSATALREMAQVDRIAQAAAHEARGECFTIRAPDGRVLYCGGALVHHDGYATLWALMADGIGARSLGHVVDIARRYIAGLPHARLDAMINAEDQAAIRWIKAFGFTLEATLCGAVAGGGDLHIYRRPTA
ncbi:hypothetical protein [Novosphingobium sp.]|uniref:hypothetical protein n=1 Tax=Novosphingobium sp. TaxID=1874826 RepID=UPI0031E02B94